MRRTHTLLVMLAAGAGLLGCRRAAVVAAPRPAAHEEYCFWTAFRTTLPPDSVVARYTSAFAALGLTNGGRSGLADTSWAQAGPAALAPAGRSAIYGARVVAYARGDTTLYRAFVTVAAAPARPDGVDAGAYAIPFGGELARLAQAHGVTSGEPGVEEARDVWRRRR